MTPVAYGASPEETLANLRAATPDRVHAVVDLVGGGYVALARELGVAPERINTIIDFEGAQAHGAATRGTADSAGRDDLAALGALVADGALQVAIAAGYPLDGVREAYTELEKRHTAGKIVLLPQE